ncbi:uncharacterized protein BcabD6B2_07620 [Babesia caballi]|uniref:Uncharacterized protein n=1 Tax=Babesia caballi TaxID=5871 RepID=A0AAV4LMD9_BABCB|nr:hypothetical protein, conserved [Babesia caballi]
MKMTSGGKSLTTPPQNLKEAIDWVLRVSGKDTPNNDGEGQKAIKGLAGTLQAMLNGDPGDVAEDVKKWFGEVSKSVMEKIKKANEEYRPTKKGSSEWGFAVPHVILNKLSEGLEPFPSGGAARVNREKAEKWVETVQGNTLETIIETLADGLKKFVAPTSGIFQTAHTSAYGQTNDKWKSLKANGRRECAIIFLAVFPLLYIALTYLYWRCSQRPDSPPSNISWSGQKLTDDKGLKKYMEVLGYTANLNDQKTGGQIVSDILEKMFSNELQTAYTKAKVPPSEDPSYPDFLEKLQGEAPKSTPPNSSPPLTSLYLISYYYITYPLHDVQSTSPATPSFAGYSGTAALAGGAYGFNLGGLGNFMSALLA